jgi:hypothetical protein
VTMFLLARPMCTVWAGDGRAVPTGPGRRLPFFRTHPRAWDRPEVIHVVAPAVMTAGGCARGDALYAVGAVPAEEDMSG